MSEVKAKAQEGGGFTLMELLVVVGIIALLAALLFPVFAHARAKGYQATCASNLRQIGLAAMLYMQDNDGRFFPALPQAYTYGDVSEIRQWCLYEVTSPNGDRIADKSRGPLSTYLKNEGIWTCPAVPDSIMPYGLNQLLIRAEIANTHPVGPLQLTESSPISLSQVNIPTETVLVTERASNGTAWGRANPFAYPPSDREASVEGRHFGFANVLWMDFHVSTRKPIASYSINNQSLTMLQLQQLNQGDILRTDYTGNPKVDDYYFEISKPSQSP